MITEVKNINNTPIGGLDSSESPDGVCKYPLTEKYKEFYRNTDGSSPEDFEKSLSRHLNSVHSQLFVRPYFSKRFDIGTNIL